jgi:ribose transport system substrate-binding protein
VWAVAAACVLAVAAGCGRKADPQATDRREAAPAAPRRLVFGVIAKSQSNPVFQAARVGAEDAARELSATLGMDIRIDWRTPNEEDAQQQANNIEQLVLQGVAGITISCSDAGVVTPAIDDAVSQGVPVMCFDSDAPASKRFCYHGIDDIDCGQTVMRELAKALGPGRHVVAILGGNQNAPNLQKRIQGVKEAAAAFPDIAIKDVYYHKETPQDAAARMEEVQGANPDIDGWALVGGWPLFTDALMKWEPGKVKIVSVDALPAQLPYVKRGIVASLQAQQVYAWGYRSVELLVDKVVHGKTPAEVRDISGLVAVTAENVDEFAKNWETWLPK